MGRVMGAQQEHSELLGGLTHLCAGTVTECESALAQQKAKDLAEVKRVEEELKLKLKEEMARRAVEQEEKERQERLREMERQRDEITAGEWMLAAQKQVLLEAEGVMGKVNDNNVDNDVASQSTVSDQTVSNCLLMICTTLTVNSNRAPPRRSRSTSVM